MAGAHDLLGRPIAMVGDPDPATEEVLFEMLQMALIEGVGELELTPLLADGDLEEQAQVLSAEDAADSLLDRLLGGFGAPVGGLLTTLQTGLQIAQLAFGLAQVLENSRLLTLGKVGAPALDDHSLTPPDLPLHPLQKQALEVLAILILGRRRESAQGLRQEVRE